MTERKYRVAIGGILVECNHFGGLPNDMARFEQYELFRGDDMRQMTTSVVGGMLAALGDRGGAAVPLIYASACAGGPVTGHCYRQLRGELLERLARSLPVDGVLMPLHGAALAEDVDDPDGDMIHAVRDMVGPDVPVVATLDLHANVTAEMVAYADALLAWETYPHVDQYSTGRRATNLLLDILEGRCRPTMAMGKVPVITSAINGGTEGDDPFADLMRFTKSLEQQPGVLSTSLILIHPYMDVPDMGSGGLVVTDDDVDTAAALAHDIAMRYWQRRHDLEPEVWTPEEAIAEGLTIEGGPVILVETADCSGGGAAGDSIASLAALVDSRVNELSLVPVVDPEAAQACHAAGEDVEITVALGHKLDPQWGPTRTFTGRVVRLSDGYFTYTGGQWEGLRAAMGQSAVLAIGSVHVLITTYGTYDWADEQFQSVGLDASTARFVVAKNPMNYRQPYGDIAREMIILDTPGPTPATLRHVKFKSLRRPYFPADPEIPGLQPTVLSGRGNPVR